MGQIHRAVVLGTGLIGTSVALALAERGVVVTLEDPDPAAVAMAVDLGAGTRLTQDDAPADVALVAAPPAVVPAVLHRAQERGLAHAYTDVASVKTWVTREADRLGCDLSTFVPSHPMGGREKAGPGAARADLFLGRSWAICPTEKTDTHAIAVVTRLAELCGAVPLTLAAQAHDRAVALVSHAPHVASSAVAARLLGGDPTALRLAGQGLRDVTRVAGGDPDMWMEILRYNAEPVADVLAAVAEDLRASATALRSDATEPTVRDLLDRGRSGQERIPGKHGAERQPEFAMLPVVIPDQPGTLARLFDSAGAAGVNIEDVRIDHSPGLPVGVAQLSVRVEELRELAQALAADGWAVHG
ncbi:prephenate dehydrogenase [Spiractinospora alimapuensis]|uniref:prephenate dehydrogenase n=1 Tax=Spiractinospora alimapuensis TaxID=2820884 RepID=UPI001EEAEE4C|nr:prephenate dehydrogenase [Spiractinospora alimapuensis]QVQ53061.1 prephenate dehydrogenase [Spiractinospora alimapuensis]